MAKSSVYSMLNVTAMVDGLRVIGLWDGDDAIVVSQGADVGEMLIGADGAGLFSQSADRSATIVLKLMHTSATHRQLLQKLAQQRAGRIIGFPFSVIEGGTKGGGSTDQAFVQVAPDDSNGNVATEREWTLVTSDWEPNIPLA